MPSPRPLASSERPRRRCRKRPLLRTSWRRRRRAGPTACGSTARARRSSEGGHARGRARSGGKRGGRPSPRHRWIRRPRAYMVSALAPAFGVRCSLRQRCLVSYYTTRRQCDAALPMACPSDSAMRHCARSTPLPTGSATPRVHPSGPCARYVASMPMLAQRGPPGSARSRDFVGWAAHDSRRYKAWAAWADQGAASATGGVAAGGVAPLPPSPSFGRQRVSAPRRQPSSEDDTVRLCGEVGVVSLRRRVDLLLRERARAENDSQFRAVRRSCVGPGARIM